MLLSNSHYLLCCDIAIECDAKKLRVFFGRPPLFHQHLISHFLCLLQLVLTLPVQGDDARLFIGASVEAKAMLITSLAECSRRFGTNAKTKVVPGLVETVPLRL